MPFVLSLRPTTVVTLLGHIIPVTPGEATFIPPAALEAALEKGCVECDKDGHLAMSAALVPKLPVSDIPQLQGDDREDKDKRATVLQLAVSKLYSDNDPTKFTKVTNLPKVNSVEELIGFPTSVAEISTAIEKLHLGK